MAGLAVLAVGLASLGTILLANSPELSPGGGPWLPGALSGGVAAWRPNLAAVLGDPRVTGLSGWPPAFDAPPILAFDFDGDGRKEVVAHGNDSRVWVFSADGKVLAQLSTRYPPAWHRERILNAVEAGVLAPGEPPSLVVTNHAAYVTVFRFDAGASSRSSFVFAKAWERRADECHRSPSMDAKPTLADVDRDGRLEILVQTEEIGFYALRADGTTLWKQCWAGGNGAPVAAELYGDGRMQVIVGSDSGLLSVLDGATGAPLWTFNAQAHGARPGSITVSPTVGELDGRLPREVLFTARVAAEREPSRYHENHVAIFAVRQSMETWQAEIVWMRQPEWANPLSYTRLVVHDVTGDGRAEVCGMDWNTIGHYPGDWERLGPAHAFCLDASGRDLWMRELDTWWSNSEILLGDFDGDGRLDILAHGPRDGYDGLWRLDAATGAPRAFLAIGDWKLSRAPIATDLFGRGTTQLVVPVEPANGGHRGAIMVFDLGVAYNVPWPGA